MYQAVLTLLAVLEMARLRLVAVYQAGGARHDLRLPPRRRSAGHSSQRRGLALP